MCTAFSFLADSFYFGRTLDYDCFYDNSVCIMPRNYELCLTNSLTVKQHYAVIGSAVVKNNYPLFFDGANEKGLCMAGLNFKDDAVYRKNINKKDNIASFELIPYILSTCSSVKQAQEKLININITDTPFDGEVLPSGLHWMIADKKGAITVESVKEGVKVYENPVGVLTNSPSFDIQLFGVNNYISLSAMPPKENVWGKYILKNYSRGMGGMGLPGDFSSSSRFVRAAFIKNNLAAQNDNVGLFFRALDNLSVPNGCCVTENGKFQQTDYACCIDGEKGVYYYVTKENRQICAVDMKKENLGGDSLIVHNLKRKQNIYFQN